MKKKYLIYVIFGVLLIAKFTIVESSGQMPPIPPPPPSNSNLDISKDLKIAKADKTPPKIEVLTEELKQGKNVVEVRITDDSDIKIKQIIFVKQGSLAETSLVEDSKNHYIGLIEVLPPSTVIRVNAIDAAQNEATIYKQIIVRESHDFLANFFSSIAKIFNPSS